MRLPALPSARALALLTIAAAVSAAALILGARLRPVVLVTAAFAGALLVALAVDFAWSRAAWRASAVRCARRLPAAFAIGVRKAITLQLENPGRHVWHVRVFDHCD